MGVSFGHLTQVNMGDQNPIWKAAAMADHFEKIQKLPDPVAGCPNFRRVPGYKVYVCGQPTVAGLEAALTKVCGETYPKEGKIIWFNLRQEPSLYVNGEPVCARPSNKIGEYAELGNITRDQNKKDEPEFLTVCQGRASANGGKLKVVDISKKEKEVEVKEMKTLSQVIEDTKAKFPGLVHMRVPVCNSAAPLEADFDTICQTLVGTNINTPVIVNDQVGLSRATTAGVIACLFKEFQINASFDGLVQTVPGVNTALLQMDRYVMDPAKDPLFRGEFNVVKQVVAALKDGAAKTGGTGIKQLRENIAESKLSYEIMEDSAQAFLKTKIMDNIHKYYYLILFTSYMREAADLAREACADDEKAALTLAGGRCSIPANQLKLNKKFVEFMSENAALRELIETGKGDLQWERDIPAASLSNLESLANSDFKANLGKIIHDIYQTAHQMFSDMPQGDHKKRAKYRFASKTLMRILPSAVKAEIEGLIEKKTISLDLYE